MSELRIKRGSTLRFMMLFQDEGGTPLDLSGMMLSAQVRSPSDDLVATLPIVVTDTTGVATVQVVTDQQWPFGLLRCDLKALIGGLPIHSETFGIRINRAVTQ